MMVSRTASATQSGRKSPSAGSGSESGAGGGGEAAMVRTLPCLSGRIDPKVQERKQPSESRLLVVKRLEESMFRWLAAFLLFLSLSAFATVTPLPGVTPQRAPAGDDFPVPIAVLVTGDDGAPVAGAYVGFSFPPPGYSPLAMNVSPSQFECRLDASYYCRVFTDANGIAQLPALHALYAGTFTLPIGASLGTRYLGGIQIVLTGAAHAATASLGEVPGASMRAATGRLFPSPFMVRLLSPNGAPIPSASVTFRVPIFPEQVRGTFAHAGNFDPYASTAITDASGVATSEPFYAGKGLGTGTVTAEYLDPVALAYVRITMNFTNTTADGLAFVSFQDLWWGGPAENGWGVAIAQHDDRLFNVFLVYDDSGAPRWWVMSSGGWAEGLGSRYVGWPSWPRSSPYFAYDASRFVEKEAGLPQLWDLTFDNERTGTLRPNIGYSPFPSKRIERLDFSSTSPAPLEGIGDIWWGGPGQDGWGIAMMEQPGGLFPI